MKIHCSGIGGIGLSAYAALRNAEGHAVSGSDRADSPLLDDLRSQGIAVTLNQDGSAVTPDLDVFVYSEAIPPTAPERVRAAELGIRQISYFAALGEHSVGLRTVAVCGTHGKSSTTAMAARVFIEAGLDPTVVVGTKLTELGGRNWRKGESDLFIVEACEYRRSFHHLSPNVIILLNADGDHFDAYADEDEYREAFVEFVRMLPDDGYVVTHMSDGDCAAIVAAAGTEAVDADAYPKVTMKTPGEHMRQNGQTVSALADRFGIDADIAQTALAGFAGTWRRMEEKGTFGDDVLVIDDYGHHPKEIAATLAALKERYPSRRRVCAFQPHTHDRTLKLYDDFVGCFADADALLLTDVYEARKDIEHDRVDMDRFVADIAETSGIPVRFVGDLEHAEAELRSEARPGDVVIAMGAGTITNVATALTKG